MPANEPKQSLPEIDFATFVLSLASNALVHLGELPEPDAEGGAGDEDANVEAAPRERNLPLARQTIEILAMLEQKTRGNLDAAETNLLGGVLYDLRMKFVDATKPTKPARSTK